MIVRYWSARSVPSVPEKDGNGWAQYQLLVLKALSDLAEQDKRLEAKHDQRWLMLEARIRANEKFVAIAVGAIAVLQVVVPFLVREVMQLLHK